MAAFTKNRRAVRTCVATVASYSISMFEDVDKVGERPSGRGKDAGKQ